MTTQSYECFGQKPLTGFTHFSLHPKTRASYEQVEDDADLNVADVAAISQALSKAGFTRHYFCNPQYGKLHSTDPWFCPLAWNHSVVDPATEKTIVTSINDNETLGQKPLTEKNMFYGGCKYKVAKRSEDGKLWVGVGKRKQADGKDHKVLLAIRRYPAIWIAAEMSLGKCKWEGHNPKSVNPQTAFGWAVTTFERLTGEDENFGAET